jgi:hypothetical protein
MKMILNVPNPLSTVEPIDTKATTTTMKMINGCKYIEFTYDFFKLHPLVFDSESLFYIQHSGVHQRPNALFMMFETLVTSYDSSYTKSSNQFQFDTNFIISWARQLKFKGDCTAFEPSMQLCKNSLIHFLSSPTVDIKGKELSLKFFKPLMYNYNGENYYDLIPYICYLFTFFIYGQAYTFEEAHTNASMYGFSKSIDSYLQQHYLRLSTEHNTKFENLINTLSNAEWKTFFSKVLAPNEIIRMRNNEMRRESGLLHENVSSQQNISQAYIDNCFNQVMSKLVYKIITHSPFSAIVKSFPGYDGKYCKYELAKITQYCFCGGDKTINIDSQFCYNYSLDQNNDMKIQTDITTLHIGKHRPFTSSDPISKMCEAFLLNEVDKKDSDPFDDSKFSLLEEDIFKHESLLRNWFISGTFQYYRSIFSDLTGKSFVDEYEDIINLPLVVMLSYGKTYAATCLSTYILSLLPKLLLVHCNNQKELSNFSLIQSVLLMTEVDIERVKKLTQVSNAITMVNNPSYITFINRKITEFTSMIVQNSIIIQPYIKELNDSVDKLAIGGCEVYNYGKSSNPFVRSYGFISEVLGTSEELFIFNKWTENLDNQSLFDIIDSSKNISLINAGLLNASKTIKIPVILNNFIFNLANKHYEYKPVNYFYNDSLVEFVVKYIYPINNVRNHIESSVVSRRIICDESGAITCDKPIINGFSIGSNVLPLLKGGGRHYKIPVYNFTGSIEEIPLLFIIPPNYHLYELLLSSSKYSSNQTILLFYKTKVVSNYDNYEPDDKSPYAKEGSSMNRAAPDSRRIKY